MSCITLMLPTLDHQLICHIRKLITPKKVVVSNVSECHLNQYKYHKVKHVGKKSLVVQEAKRLSRKSMKIRFLWTAKNINIVHQNISHAP